MSKLKDMIYIFPVESEKIGDKANVEKNDLDEAVNLCQPALS